MHESADTSNCSVGHCHLLRNSTKRGTTPALITCDFQMIGNDFVINTYKHRNTRRARDCIERQPAALARIYRATMNVAPHHAGTAHHLLNRGVALNGEQLTEFTRRLLLGQLVGVVERLRDLRQPGHVHLHQHRAHHAPNMLVHNTIVTRGHTLHRDPKKFTPQPSNLHPPPLRLAAPLPGLAQQSSRTTTSR